MNKRIYAFIIGSFIIAQVAWGQVRFDRPHGLYEVDELTVTIAPSEEGTEIRYTTDGTVPTMESPRYTAPLKLTGTTLLRAGEVRGDTVTLPVTTASYIFMNSVLTQPDNPEGYPTKWGEYTQFSGRAIADYEMDPEMTEDAVLRPKIMQGLRQLPILSIVTDKENLFNHENDEQTGGIYIYTGPPVGDATGHGWTRPASAELIGGPSKHSMQVDCGLRLHGGHGRLAEKNPKHSFRLVFKDEYGPGSLKYPIYGEDEPVKFNQLVLRCHFGNSWQHWGGDGNQRAQYTRDLWARKMQRRMGHPAVNGIHVHLFLNGMYWGLYNIAERVDDEYGKQHFGGEKSDYDVVKIEESGGNHHEAAEGDLEAWHEMISTVSKASDDVYYYQLQGLDENGEKAVGGQALLDVDGFIDYMLINQYGGNTDWDHHNWYAIRKRGSDSEGFHFLCWDTEQIFEGNNDNVMKVNNYASPTWIFHELLQNTQFVNRYLKRAAQVLSEEGPLGEASVVQLWDSLYNTISDAVYVEAARWGDYRRDVHPYQSKRPLYTVDEFYLKERDRLKNQYFPYRTATALSQVNAYVEKLTGIYYDDWDVPDHWIPMTASMFKEWNGTGADAQPKDKQLNVDWNLNTVVSGGGVVMMSASVTYNQFADLTPYDTLVLRGVGDNLRIIANRLVDHGSYKQIIVSFNENDAYWNSQWGAIFLPLADVAKALTNEGDERVDDFVHVNALKVAYGGGTTNLRKAYLIPAIPVDKVHAIMEERVAGDGIYYNLLGQPVTRPTNGIYIHNGRKVVVR